VSSGPSELTLSWAPSSAGMANDFLRVFFFFPPLWFLRRLEEGPDDVDGGFGGLVEVERGIPSGCCRLDESIAVGNPSQRVSTGWANQTGRMAGVF